MSRKYLGKIIVVAIGLAIAGCLTSEQAEKFKQYKAIEEQRAKGFVGKKITSISELKSPLIIEVEGGGRIEVSNSEWLRINVTEASDDQSKK